MYGYLTGVELTSNPTAALIKSELTDYTGAEATRQPPLAKCLAI